MSTPATRALTYCAILLVFVLMAYSYKAGAFDGVKNILTTVETHGAEYGYALSLARSIQNNDAFTHLGFVYLEPDPETPGLFVNLGPDPKKPLIKWHKQHKVTDPHDLLSGLDLTRAVNVEVLTTNAKQRVCAAWNPPGLGGRSDFRVANIHYLSALACAEEPRGY